MNDSSVLLNDDLLVLILRRLPLKELVCLQPVSQQFQSCIEFVLRNWPEVLFKSDNSSFASLWPEIGNSKYLLSIDITPALQIYWGLDLVINLPERQSPFETLLDRHSNVRTIYLNQLRVNFETIKVITDRCKRLDRLNLFNVTVKKVDNKTPKDWVKILSKIKHMKIATAQGVDLIGEENVIIWTNVLQQLSSLQSFQLLSSHIRPSVLAECLPANIRTLMIEHQNLDSDSLRIIVTKCTKITHLSVGKHSNLLHDDWRQWFVMICNHLPHLRALTILLQNMSPKEFAENISKLKSLKHLSIKSTIVYNHMNGMSFDINSMRPHLQHPIKWRSLTLNGIICSPKKLSNLHQMLPEVRRLTVGYIKTGSPRKYHQFMECVSKLPQLRELTIGECYYAPTFQTLDLFAGLPVLKITQELNGLTNLVRFVTRSLKNTKHFHLCLLTIVADRLANRMAEKHKQLPDNVIVSRLNYF